MDRTRLSRRVNHQLRVVESAGFELKPGMAILDFGCGEGNTVRMLREAGFDAATTVKIMTLNGATYLGRTADVGRIAPGLRADLIAFAAPLDAAKPALPEVAWTMKAGRAWDRAKILNAWKGQVGLR